MWLTTSSISRMPRPQPQPCSSLHGRREEEEGRPCRHHLVLEQKHGFKIVAVQSIASWGRFPDWFRALPRRGRSLESQLPSRCSGSMHIITSLPSPLLFGPELLLLQSAQKRERGTEKDEGGRNEEIKKERRFSRKEKRQQTSEPPKQLMSKKTKCVNSTLLVFRKGSLVSSGQ